MVNQTIIAPTLSELCIDVLHAFSKLLETLEQLHYNVCILDKNLPCVFESLSPIFTINTNNDREKAYSFISQLEYLAAQEPREILIGCGLVASSQATLDMIEKLNLSKIDFKEKILMLRNLDNYSFKKNSELNLAIEKILESRDPEFAAKMRRMGLSRLHLKQCYRQIPYYTERPSKISWTWAHTRSIKKISVAQARELLIKLGQDSGIMTQLSKLDTIAADEKLAIIQELAPHLRANLVFKTGDVTDRVMVKGPVPIFYLHSVANPQLPQYKPPKTDRDKNPERGQRSDVKICQEPFLPAIHAHRYIIE